MHMLIDDLDCPNTSMTISSLSQSPWQGTKSTQSYLSNLTSQRLTANNEGADSARNENLESQNKSKNELANFIGTSLSSSEYGDLQNVQVSQHKLTGPFQQVEPSSHSVRSPYRDNQHQTSVHSSFKRAGSPEFAKELTVTDDLTVSHTDENFNENYTDENQDGGTYRGPGF